MNELYSNYLEHHGILGQKWGVRRYQNADGSLTEAGRRRYGVEGERTAKQTTRRLNDLDQAIAYNVRDYNDANKVLNKFSKKAGRKKRKGKELSDRDNKKIKAEAEKLLNAALNIEEGHKETERILKEIPDGFDLRQYDVPRDVTKFTERLLYGAAGAFYQRNVWGVEYQVKNKSKKQHK